MFSGVDISRIPHTGVTALKHPNLLAIIYRAIIFTHTEPISFSMVVSLCRDILVLITRFLPPIAPNSEQWSRGFYVETTLGDHIE